MSTATVTSAPPAPADEQSRARYPDETGTVTRDGVSTFYEVYENGAPTILLMPTWTIFRSRFWKTQIPYLARHFRVVTFDGRGGGRSDRPASESDYAIEEVGRDAIAVMDATGTERAGIVASSRGTQFGLWLATQRPERVSAMVAVTPFFPVSWRSLHFRVVSRPRMMKLARRPLPTYPGWLKMNPNHLVADYPDFLGWFVGQATNDRHSTKQFEDFVGYGSETTGDVADATAMTVLARTRADLLALAREVRCPVLVVHGTKDRITPYADGKALSKATGGELITMPGVGHLPAGRYPVVVNIALRRFFENVS